MGSQQGGAGSGAAGWLTLSTQTLTHSSANTHTLPRARTQAGAHAGGARCRAEELFLIKAHQGCSFSTGGRVGQEHRGTPAAGRTVGGRRERAAENRTTAAHRKSRAGLTVGLKPSPSLTPKSRKKQPQSFSQFPPLPCQACWIERVYLETGTGCNSITLALGGLLQILLASPRSQLETVAPAS